MEFHPLLCSLFNLGVMAGRLPLLWFPVWLLPLNLQPPAPVPAPPPIRRIKPSTSPWDVLQDNRRWNSFHYWRLLVMCVSLGLINVREADPLVQFSVANFAGCSVSRPHSQPRLPPQPVPPLLLPCRPCRPCQRGTLSSTRVASLLVVWQSRVVLARRWRVGRLQGCHHGHDVCHG